MDKVGAFYEWTQQYKGNEKVAFVVCYVTEAHPRDEWKIVANKRQPSQAKNIAQRMDALKYLIEDIECEINEKQGKQVSLLKDTDIRFVADSLDENNLDRAFNARPDRLAIIKDNVIVYKCGYGPFLYDIDGARKFLAPLVSP
mmetsp:Transcript_7623/g.11836  ORF Transcript_7623/g.11836 Transcript_7623/m.11836 type:complete len:143 (+) Transcript_7623:416-844(+)